MARAITPLTNTKIKNTKPKDKDYKLFDGGGLFCLSQNEVLNYGD